MKCKTSSLFFSAFQQYVFIMCTHTSKKHSKPQLAWFLLPCSTASSAHGRNNISGAQCRSGFAGRDANSRWNVSISAPSWLLFTRQETWDMGRKEWKNGLLLTWPMLTVIMIMPAKNSHSLLHLDWTKSLTPIQKCEQEMISSQFCFESVLNDYEHTRSRAH